jgi:plastocyanin
MATFREEHGRGREAMATRIIRAVALRRVVGRALAGLVVVVVVGASLAGTASAKTTKVAVDDNFFKPKRVTVHVGDKVTWKWEGFVAHNVTVEKGPKKFKSATKSDGTFSRVIKKPGVYRIVCTIHPGMTMKLTAVKARPPTTTTTSTPATTAPPGP